MFRIDTWQEILFTLKRNKLRTILTSTGVFWGILILILLLGSGKGMENGILSMFGDKIVNSVYFWANTTSIPYKGLPVERQIVLTNEDVQILEKKYSSEIEHLAPRINLGKKLLLSNVKNGAYPVRGEMPAYFNIEPVTLVEGRLINRIDISESRNVIIIGQYLKSIFFGKEQAIGKSLSYDGKEFQVVGVFKSSKLNNTDKKDEQKAFIPFSVAQKMRSNQHEIDQIACSFYPHINANAAEKKMKNFLKRHHQIHPKDRHGLRATNMAKEFKQFSGLFAAVNSFVWFVGLGTLVAGIVGVGNIMLITVKERTKEIGIRKALGEQPHSIIISILMESISITAVSGYLGLLTGTITIYIVNFVLNNFNLNSRYFANPEIDFAVGLKALLVLIIAGVLAGLIPAIQASKVHPVEALRNE